MYLEVLDADHIMYMWSYNDAAATYPKPVFPVFKIAESQGVKCLVSILL